MGEAGALRGRSDPAAELASARHSIEGHEAGIIALEVAIARRRRDIDRLRAVVARLEAKLAPAADGAGAKTGEG